MQLAVVLSYFYSLCTNSLQRISMIEARIKALRLQIMIHSIIYYELNESIISDAEWSKRARELVELQRENPSVSTVFDEAFKDFDGSTGFHLLAYADDAARGKARYLCEISRCHTGAKSQSRTK